MQHRRMLVWPQAERGWLSTKDPSHSPKYTSSGEVWPGCAGTRLKLSMVSLVRSAPCINRGGTQPKPDAHYHHLGVHTAL